MVSDKLQDLIKGIKEEIIPDKPTIDKEGNTTEMMGKGRHDPCVVPRAVPIVEAMAALVLADNVLLNKTSRV